MRPLRSLREPTSKVMAKETTGALWSSTSNTRRPFFNFTSLKLTLTVLPGEGLASPPASPPEGRLSARFSVRTAPVRPARKP